MSDFDVIVRGRDHDFGIVEGKFAAIQPNLSGSCGEEINATEALVLPGMIDSHVHFNEPGRADWEGFDSGSRAAAAGGVTTIFDMPLNAHPPTIDGPSFDAKKSAAQSKSRVDFGLWGGLVPGNLDQLEELHDRGVIGLKAFMCDSGMDDFPRVTTSVLREGMKRAAKLNLLVAVHAESQQLTEQLTKEKLAANKSGPRDYLESRPLDAELNAIQCAVELAGETNCRLHIVHVSSGRAVETIATARANGIDVTCETCPHYLLLTDVDLERLGPVAKCAPPLRSAHVQQSLRDAVSKIDTIGSDHSPCPWPMKDRSNFFEVWGGISGCQHSLALLLTAGLPQNSIAELTSSNVAARFRLHAKGGITAGKDADLTILNPAPEEAITAESLFYRHRYTPYLGRRLRYRVERTILRGQTLFSGGKIAGLPSGKFVRPDDE